MEIGFYPGDCIGCGECERACRAGAIDLARPDRLDRHLCNLCGDCVRACPGGALRLIGAHYTIQELTAKLLQDRVYYEVSSGGVTFSGGEPTLHLDYLARLLPSLKEEGLHLAIQTNGFFDWRQFKKILAYLDLIMFDVKLADAGLHLHYTGRRNDLIWSNLSRLLKTRAGTVLPRIPLVPGMTATSANLEAISRQLQRLGVSRCSLLPYNPTWFSKAENIGGSVCPELPRRLLTPAEEQACREIFSWAELVQP